MLNLQNWYKLPEAASLLGISEITLRRRIKQGKLPCQVLNGKYYVELENDSKLGRYFLKSEPTLFCPKAALPPALSQSTLESGGSREEWSELQKKIAELESKNKKLLRKNVDLESLVQALEWQLEQMHENVDSEPPLS
jgi:hypothetical protein